ncbi:MAG: hypothetical protein ACOH2D_07885 [Gelidibacter sp.]
MKKRVIEAIKNFDSDALDALLDNEKSYMEVSKSLFISTLKSTFESVKEDGCQAFDDVFFGICGSCNKGCEGMTFLSNSGHYLDIFIESKDDYSVDDIYVCNDLSNLTGLEKLHDLSFDFDEDEKVLFTPNNEYLLIKEQYELLLSELRNLEDGITLDEFVAWYDGFIYLRDFINDLDPFSNFPFKLFNLIYVSLWKLDNIVEIKTKSEHVLEALIDFEVAKTERDQLIWFFENEEDQFISTFDMDVEGLDSNSHIAFRLDEINLIIDISGYEYVLDYFLKLENFHDHMMEKYEPLPQHYQKSETGEIIPLLHNYLRLHNKFLDLLERYRPDI